MTTTSITITTKKKTLQQRLATIMTKTNTKTVIIIFTKARVILVLFKTIYNFVFVFLTQVGKLPLYLKKRCKFQQKSVMSNNNVLRLRLGNPGAWETPIDDAIFGGGRRRQTRRQTKVRRHLAESGGN